MVMGFSRWVVVAVLAGAFGCGAEKGPATTAPSADVQQDAVTATDTADVTLDTETVADAGATPPDASPTGCAKLCQAFKSCYLDLAPDECLEICDQADASSKEVECLQTSDGCKAVAECLGVAAKVVTPFAAGPYGTEPMQTAGTFQVRTARGFYSLQERWTGSDTYFFIVRSGGYSYTENFYKSPIEPLMEAAPANAHFFFVSMANKDGTDEHEAHVLGMKARWDDALTKLTLAERRKWRKRVHFILDRLPMPNDTIGPGGFTDGWLGEMGKEQGRFCFAIDRFQKTRECGNVRWPPTGSAAIQSLSTLAFLGRHFDFEYDRVGELAAEKVTELPFVKGKKTYDAMVRYVEFPPAAEMATYDRLSVDLAITCQGRWGRNCAGMHEMVQLHLCDLPSETTPVHGQTPCNEEIARWSLATGSEGRWVTDITPVLGLLSDGGTRRLRLYTPAQKRTIGDNTFDVKFVVDLRFRLATTAPEGLRPFASQTLWSDPAASFEPFDAGYNGRHAPVKLSPPQGWKKAEVHGLITGHGWGQEQDNCAIFCNHTHRVQVGGKSWTRAHPQAGSVTGCSDQVGKGVVPNQTNAWRNGRSGWCPGRDVTPWVADITEGVLASKDLMLTYEASLDGKPYVPKPAANPHSSGAPASVLRALRVVWWK